MVLVDCAPCGSYGAAYPEDEEPFIVLDTDEDAIGFPEHTYKGIACSHTEERLITQGKIPVDRA